MKTNAAAWHVTVANAEHLRDLHCALAQTFAQYISHSFAENFHWFLSLSLLLCPSLNRMFVSQRGCRQ